MANVAKAVAADSEPESEEEAAPVAPAVDESSEDGVGGLDASAGEVDDKDEDDDDGDETDSPIVKRRSGGSAFALLGGDEDEDEDEDETRPLTRDELKAKTLNRMHRRVARGDGGKAAGKKAGSKRR